MYEDNGPKIIKRDFQRFLLTVCPLIPSNGLLHVNCWNLNLIGHYIPWKRVHIRDALWSLSHYHPQIQYGPYCRCCGITRIRRTHQYLWTARIDRIAIMYAIFLSVSFSKFPKYYVLPMRDALEKKINKYSVRSIIHNYMWCRYM